MSEYHPRSAATLLTIFLLAGCASAPLPPPPAPPPRVGDLSFEPYVNTLMNGMKYEGQLGRLIVPENRSDPDSNLIEIAFFYLKCTGADPGPPIFLLTGGPGGSGVADTRRYTGPFEEIRKIGDVVCMDQRGVGLSRPNLRTIRRYDIPVDMASDSPEALEIAKRAHRAAYQGWMDSGVDLTGYTTEESADDIDDIRRALGAEKMSLFGGSYGTHLSFSVLRRHGDKVHRAILQGSEGPDHTYKRPAQIQAGLELVAELVAADPETSKLIPDFIGMLRSVLDRLEAEPAMVKIDQPGRGEIIVRIDKIDVQSWASGAIGRITNVVTVPRILYDMDGGDFSYLARRKANQTHGVGSAMAMMMDCASGITPERRALIEREAGEYLLGDAVNGSLLDLCESWGSPDLGEDFRAPLRSDVRTLFFSGTLDSRTPASNAEEIRAGFSDSEHVILVNAGHDNRLFASEPVAEQTLRFLRDEPLTTRRIEFPPPKFDAITPR